MLKLYFFNLFLCLSISIFGQKVVSEESVLEQKNPAKKNLLQAEYLKKQGLKAYERGTYSSALDYYQKSLEIYQKIGHQQGRASVLKAIGIIYNYQGKYPEALETYQKSLQIFEQIGDKIGLAETLNNLGGLYINQGNKAKALIFFQKALKTHQESNNQAGLARGMNNVGGIYIDKKNYDSAMYFFEQALLTEKKAGISEATSSAFSNIAEIYAHKLEYTKALDFYQKSDSVAKHNGVMLDLVYNALGMALVYQHLKKYEQSIENAERGFHIARKMGALREYAFMSKAIYNIHREQKNYQKALEYHEIYKKMNDSLFNIEKQKVLQNLEIQGELDKKNTEIKQEKAINYQQKIINYWIFAGLMLTVLLLVIILIAKNKQEKANAIILKQKSDLDKSHEKLRETNHELEKIVENLHRTQAHLVHSEKAAAFGLIMATISHEINNPLNYIKGSSDFLEESSLIMWDYIQKVQKISDPEKIRNLYQEMEIETVQEDNSALMGNLKLGVNRIAEIVQSLKTFVRLDEQGVKQANISKNFEAVLIILRSRFLGKIEIKTDFEANLPLIYCNISQINQVFLGLLLNAIEAIDNKGEIKVRTFQDDHFVIFSIQDNGAGIPTHIQAHIFEAFVSSKKKSAGIGLYIAKTIIEEHQGKIQFENLEKGTIFTVFLPKN